MQSSSELILIFEDMKDWGIVVLGNINLLTSTVAFAFRNRADDAYKDEHAFKAALEKELQYVALPANPQLCNMLITLGYKFYTFQKDKIVDAALATKINAYFLEEEGTKALFALMYDSLFKNSASTIYESLAKPFSTSIHTSIKTHLRAYEQANNDGFGSKDDTDQEEMTEEEEEKSLGLSQPIRNVYSIPTEVVPPVFGDQVMVEPEIETPASFNNSAPSVAILQNQLSDVISVIPIPTHKDEDETKSASTSAHTSPEIILDDENHLDEELDNNDVLAPLIENQNIFNFTSPPTPLRRKYSSLLEDLLREGFNPTVLENKVENVAANEEKIILISPSRIANMNSSDAVIETLLAQNPVNNNDQPNVFFDVPLEPEIELEEKSNQPCPLPLPPLLANAVAAAIRTGTQYINLHPNETPQHTKHSSAVELRRAATFLLFNTDRDDTEKLTNDFYAACKKITTFWTGDLKAFFWEKKALQELVKSAEYKAYLTNPKPVSENAVTFGKFKNP